MAGVNMFFTNFTRNITNLYYCIVKGFPLRSYFLCDINFLAIPETCILSHPFGIVIRPDAIIGEYCIFRQGVTIGVRRTGISENPAIIGHNVDFGAKCTILGSVEIGDGVTIGAGAIVLNDIPAGTVVTGVWK